MKSMKVSLLAIAAQANVPTVLVGRPGIGKSETVMNVASRLGYGCVQLYASQMSDPSDITGLPRVDANAGRTDYYPPAWVDMLCTDGPSVLFVDEVNLGNRLVRAAALALILDGKIGRQYLPKTVRRIGAMNPPEMSVGGSPLEPPLMSRLFLINWDDVSAAEVADYVRFGASSIDIPILPEGWESGISTVNEYIIAFLTSRPDLLCASPSDIVAGRPFPNPRSWFKYAAPLLAAIEATKEHWGNDIANARIAVLSGCVGDGAAHEFVHWLSAQDLPDPHSVLSGEVDWQPDKSRPDAAYAVVNSVVAAAIAKGLNQQLCNRCWDIIGRVISAGMAGTASVAARNLMAAGGSAYDVPEHILDAFADMFEASGIM